MIGRRSHDEAQSFDEAWNGAAPRDEHVAELVRLAESLCEVAATVEPSVSFRDSLRAQLMTEAVEVLVPVVAEPRQPVVVRGQSRSTRRRIASATAALVASAGVVGIVASSASAVPGEMLYPVKRSVENVELQLHRDDASRGEFRLAQASERLAEARTLSRSDSSHDAELLVSTLGDFSDQANAAWTALESDYTANGSQESMTAVASFATSAAGELSSIAQTVPVADNPAVANAAETVKNLASAAGNLCSSCAPADVASLAGAVTDTVKGTKPRASSDTKATAPATPGKAAPSKQAAAPSSAPAKPAATTPAPARTTSPAPASNAPATTKAPSLGDVTTPLIGGLLGDGTQKGLVPGLLEGLLGTPKSK